MLRRLVDAVDHVLEGQVGGDGDRAPTQQVTRYRCSRMHTRSEAFARWVSTST
jgi:hypothetical protein